MQINSHVNLKITERILLFLDIKGITKYKFHKDLGFSNGFLDKKRDIGTDKYAKILEYLTKIDKYINSDWLLTGRGEMLKNDEGNIKRAPPEIETLKTRLKEKDEIIEALRASIKAKDDLIGILKQQAARRDSMEKERGKKTA